MRFWPGFDVFDAICKKMLYIYITFLCIPLHSEWHNVFPMAHLPHAVQLCMCTCTRGWNCPHHWVTNTRGHWPRQTYLLPSARMTIAPWWGEQLRQVPSGISFNGPSGLSQSSSPSLGAKNRHSLQHVWCFILCFSFRKKCCVFSDADPKFSGVMRGHFKCPASPPLGGLHFSSAVCSAPFHL